MNFEVKSIPSKATYNFILNNHYARRKPSISFSFGLFKRNVLIGILTIGKPASNPLCVGVCGKENSKYVYELNRLFIIDGEDKNTASYFVSKCIKLITNRMILVSYADTALDHHGYIYQATNFIYTGKTKERTDIGKADGKHCRHYDKTIDKKENRVFRSSKHRYIYFIGSKTEVKHFKKALNYKIEKYPKGENQLYDTGLVIAEQALNNPKQK